MPSNIYSGTGLTDPATGRWKLRTGGRAAVRSAVRLYPERDTGVRLVVSGSSGLDGTYELADDPCCQIALWPGETPQGYSMPAGSAASYSFHKMGSPPGTGFHLYQFSNGTWNTNWPFRDALWNWHTGADPFTGLSYSNFALRGAATVSWTDPVNPQLGPHYVGTITIG